MTRVVTVDVRDEEYAALKYLSVRYGKSIQDVIRDAIRDYVTKASLTLGTEPWLQESLRELAAALCPVSPHAGDPNHPSSMSGMCPHPRGITSQTPTGQGTRMLTVVSHAGQDRLILSKI